MRTQINANATKHAPIMESFGKKIMNWNEAFQDMQNGWHVKRPHWLYWCFQIVKNGEIRTYRIKNGLDERIDLTLTDEDLNANDWESRDARPE